MDKPENEPIQESIERLLTDEERETLRAPGVPDDVKNEIMERLERFREADLEHARAEDAGNEP